MYVRVRVALTNNIVILEMEDRLSSLNCSFFRRTFRNIADSIEFYQNYLYGKQVCTQFMHHDS